MWNQILNARQDQDETFEYEIRRDRDETGLLNYFETETIYQFSKKMRPRLNMVQNLRPRRDQESCILQSRDWDDTETLCV